MAPVQTVDKDALRVLITGFGAFAHFKTNPSWLAVKPLHGKVLQTDPQTPSQTSGKKIHCSSLLIPVTYGGVLSTVPGLHARPPRLPDANKKSEDTVPAIAPPKDGYDLIIHIGVGDKGPLCMEKAGHKLGYTMKDANGDFAPATEVSSSAPVSSPNDASPSKAEARERRRLKGGTVTAAARGGPRGFGEGYADFAAELFTDVDVDKLCVSLQGSDQVYKRAYTSTDAGHYLCDFIYYCSLAEALRTNSSAVPPKKRTRVLFMHVPPENEPHTIEEMTEAIRRIVVRTLSTN